AAGIERELFRHGCRASADGIWNGADAEAAAEFSRLAGQAATPGAPTDAAQDWAVLLEVLRMTPAPSCTDRVIHPLALGTTGTHALGPADLIDAYGTFA